jgi:branched-chain amino acid transport system ATP-binding protein
MAELLALQGVTAGYGESVVLEDVSLEVGEGESLAILGRNGVGKSTLLLTVMGFTGVHAGTIRWRGGDLASLLPHGRAREGLGWVPQERGMFPSLTVEEHLTSVARPGAWNLKRVYDLFPKLADRRGNLGNQLSGGEQQMLAIARALVLKPAAPPPRRAHGGSRADHRPGVDEGDRRARFRWRMAVIVVEQHARLALALTERTIVIERGRIVHRASSKALLADRDTLDRLMAVS